AGVYHRIGYRRFLLSGRPGETSQASRRILQRLLEPRFEVFACELRDVLGDDQLLDGNQRYIRQLSAHVPSLRRAVSAHSGVERVCEHHSEALAWAATALRDSAFFSMLN